MGGRAVAQHVLHLQELVGAVASDDGEAEPLGGSTQVERLRARPGERLLLRPGRSGGRHLTRLVPILLLGLNGGQKQTVLLQSIQILHWVVETDLKLDF